MSRLFAAAAVLALVLAPSLADARLGSGSSMGSRGGRTYSAPPPTATAPSSVMPMDRTMTPRANPAPGYAGGGYQSAPQSRFGGFGAGLLGGLLGAGIGGMLFGHGMFGGGGFGFIGLLLQLALLFFIGRWLLRMFMQRPAMAGPGGMPNLAYARTGGAPGAGSGGMGGGSAPSRQVTITPADYQAFERTLQEMQAAWSAQDLTRLQSCATPEMVGYFGEQLAEQRSRGVRNTVTDVRLERGDLSEAWSEGGREYATVAMRFSSVDVTTDSAGRIVDGNPQQRSTATELWTFVRSAGGRWLLSAIQQGR